MDAPTNEAALRMLVEHVDVEAAALRKVVDNFSSRTSTVHLDMNWALLEVNVIATRLEQLSMHAKDVLEAATKVKNDARPSGVDADATDDIDPDNIIPSDYVEPQEYYGAYSDHFAEMNQHKATLIELRREEVTIMKEEHLDKVMAMDLDKMDAMSREYFRKRKDIVRRMFGAYSDHFAEMNQHKATLIELRREEVTIMKEEHLDKVMAMDLYKMDTMSREYFRKRKEDIVRRMFGPREQ